MKTTISELLKSSWKVCIQLAAIWISVQAIMETRGFPHPSLKWKLVGYFITAVIITGNVLLYTGLFSKFGVMIRRWVSGLHRVIRIITVIILNTLPGFLLIYTDWGNYFTGLYLRIAIYLIVSAMTALLLFPADNKWKTAQGLLLSLGISAFLFSFIVSLSGVRTTPFSLSWSEGNRFYDYSLTFAKNLYSYTGNLSVPYNSPGRYALWGSLFLIPGLPIWVHRLWDALLWVLTPLILTGILTRKIEKPLLRWGIMLWGALFIMQGPVYPHLLVPMILLALFLWSDKLWVRIIAGATISYYAGISRFTWAILPGTWLVLNDLVNDYPERTGSWIKKLIPPTLLGLAGILPGVIASWGGIIEPGQNLTFKQPLLSYRLFPNPTYGEGILLGAAITFLPLIVMLVWLIGTGKWKIGKLALAAMMVSLTGFLILGLVASIKIGGGSNLHNLDMFILTLVFLAVIAVTKVQSQIESIPIKVPQWIMIILLIIIVTPGWFAFRSGSPFKPDEHQVLKKALITIQQEVDKEKNQGEILFIDQRQLLTFHSITGVTLISDYEKKYMMDQAMGNNEQYFANFNQDLSSKRFKLIISDILKKQYQRQDEAFSEENNAYVNWVSRPVLRYYEPIVTIKELGIQLLVPK